MFTMFLRGKRMRNEDQLRETYDDPFKLAREFAAEWKLTYWKGKFYEPEHGGENSRMTLIHEEDVKLSLAVDIKLIFDCESREENLAPDKVTTKVVNDAMLALKALVY